MLVLMLLGLSKTTACSTNDKFQILSQRALVLHSQVFITEHLYISARSLPHWLANVNCSAFPKCFFVNNLRLHDEMVPMDDSKSVVGIR